MVLIEEGLRDSRAFESLESIRKAVGELDSDPELQPFLYWAEQLVALLNYEISPILAAVRVLSNSRHGKYQELSTPDGLTIADDTEFCRMADPGSDSSFQLPKVTDHLGPIYIRTERDDTLLAATGDTIEGGSSYSDDRFTPARLKGVAFNDGVSAWFFVNGFG